MKRIKNITTIASALLVVATLTALGGCSGVLGMGTYLAVQLPDGVGSAGGRYIAGGAVDAHVVVARQNKAYSYNSFEGTPIVSGQQYYVTNLVPGDYIVGVALLDGGDDMLNLRVMEVPIEKGFNDIQMTMGPGIDTLTINGLDIDNPLLPDGFTSEFRTDTLILGGLRDGNESITFIPDGGSVSAANYIVDGVVGGGAPGGPVWNFTTQDGIRFTLDDPDIEVKYLTIILE